MRSIMSAIDRKAFSEEKPAACLLAIILISHVPAKWCRFNRKCSRTSRLIRLRLTAGPTFLVTVMPIRDRPRRLGEKIAMKCSFCIRRRDSARARYSRRFKILSALVRKKRNGQSSHLNNRKFSFRADKDLNGQKDKPHAALQNICRPGFWDIPSSRPMSISYPASRTRPLARRRFIIRRPCLVDIRFKKPWFLARLILLGWNVLFILKFPHSLCLSGDNQKPYRWLPALTIEQCRLDH